VIKKNGLFIVGTRPEIIKTYPLINALKADVLFTGQHFDKKMSDSFLRYIKKSNIYKINKNYTLLSHNEITNNINNYIEKLNPSYVVVQGDTNSTLFGAIAAKYSNKKLFYIESGLRSNDLSQVEEYNRFIISKLADINFCNHQSNVDTLINEGIDSKNIYLSGSTVFAALNPIIKNINNEKNLNAKDFILLTMHRPSNTDSPENFINLLMSLDSLGEKLIFPIHPRISDKKLLNKIEKLKNIKTVKPLNYEKFIEYCINSKFIISDSGGLQEESAILNKTLIIPRKHTERPELLEVNNFLAKNVNEVIKLSKLALNNQLQVEKNRLLYGKQEVIRKMKQKIMSSI
jgi:UDP-N-acetylglucosamine 2-epimerase